MRVVRPATAPVGTGAKDRFLAHVERGSLETTGRCQDCTTKPLETGEQRPPFLKSSRGFHSSLFSIGSGISVSPCSFRFASSRYPRSQAPLPEREAELRSKPVPERSLGISTDTRTEAELGGQRVAAACSSRCSTGLELRMPKPGWFFCFAVSCLSRSSTLRSSGCCRHSASRLK